MVIKNKKALIEKLTGIHSSKKSYYVQLKKKIDETTRRNIQLEIINQLAKGIGIEMSFQEIIESVIPELQAVVSFNTLSLYVIDRGTMVSRTVFVSNNHHGAAVEGTVQERVERKDEKATAALWKVLASKKTIVVDHGTGETSGEDLPSMTLIPLLVKEKVIGVLEVISGSGFEESDLHFLEQVADQLAVGLENARLYSEVWQHKQEWEITFSAVTDLLLFINRDCRIQRVNQAVIDFFTMPEEEILGQKCYRLFYGRESKCNPCLADQVVRTEKTAYLQSRTRFNRVLDIFAYPAYTEKNKPYGVTYYAKDVTRFVDSIKFVSLGEMSAGVAHELNSPLTAIVGNSQLLLRETGPDDPHYQLIKDIKNSGMRCQRIIQNLLTFSRQEEYTFEEIDLNKVVESALSLLSYQIEKSNVELVNRPAPEMPLLLGNEHGLEQIIINLLLNAKDAISSRIAEGNTREKGRIIIETCSTDKVVAVHISDNGVGIDYADLPQVFNPFFTTKRVGRGTGLGLSVSLGIAQSHGGVIDVESIEGGGSKFSLILPLDKAYEKELEDCARE
ncbi:MAG: GAF domain-containing protein [Firmicutes bacterium]|nr:GAF domain-containing protein [Bacillota bacterium]